MLAEAWNPPIPRLHPGSNTSGGPFVERRVHLSLARVSSSTDLSSSLTLRMRPGGQTHPRAALHVFAPTRTAHPGGPGVRLLAGVLPPHRRVVRLDHAGRTPRAVGVRLARAAGHHLGLALVEIVAPIAVRTAAAVTTTAIRPALPARLTLGRAAGDTLVSLLFARRPTGAGGAAASTAVRAAFPVCRAVGNTLCGAAMRRLVAELPVRARTAGATAPVGAARPGLLALRLAARHGVPGAHIGRRRVTFRLCPVRPSHGIARFAGIVGCLRALALAPLLVVLAGLLPLRAVGAGTHLRVARAEALGRAAAPTDTRTPDQRCRRYDSQHPLRCAHHALPLL